MQTNLDLTKLINECLSHPVNHNFKGGFETFISILFSGYPENDDKIYTKEDFLGLKPNTNIVEMLYFTMEETITEGTTKEFNRLCYCHDKIDFNWDNDSFFYHCLIYDNNKILETMLAYGFEINDKCIEHYDSKSHRVTTHSKCNETIDTLILNHKLQNELVQPESKLKVMKI